MTAIADLPLLSFADWLQLPAGSSVLLTVNARLQRALETEWLGDRRAAPAPRICTSGQWLDNAVRPLLLRGECVPPGERLSAFEETWLWEQVINAGAGATLLDTWDAARLAREAHALLQEWPQPVPPADLTPEYTQYLDWQKQFHARCERLGRVDDARWQAWQRSALSEAPHMWPQHLVLAGLDDMSPAWQALLARLMAGGVQVSRLVRSTPAPDRRRVPCADAADELLQAIHWAAAALQSGRRVALVLPDLGSRRATVCRLLDEVLHPECSDPGRFEQPRLYNVSLGEALSRQAPIRAALAALGLLLADDWQLPEASPWLLSPWLCRSDELAARAAREAGWRRKGISRLDWSRLRAEAWAQPWLDARTTLRSSSRAHPSQWAERICAALQTLGWPGTRRLSSHEFQMLEAWRAELEAWRRLDDVCGAVDGRTALTLLRRTLDQRIFQPQSEAAAPLQVLGLLETAGGSFDALWLLGMTDKTLPARPQPNPLLPPHWQRQQQTPHSSSAREAAFARRLLLDVETCAPHIIASWPRFEGETELRPSPLLADWPTVEVGAAVSGWTPGPTLQRLADDQGLPLPAGRRVPGGAHVLELQARHPQWAYAECRLGTQPLEPWSSWPDARLRGNLTHAALERLWQSLPGQTELLHLAPADELRLLVAAIDNAIEADSQVQQLCGKHWLILERARLLRLLRRWLALERGRPALFRIAGLEVERPWSHGTLALTLRIDRMDHVAGGLLLVDYKTGRVNTAGWGRPDDKPLIDVQLPLYATVLGQDARVVGAAFACLHPREFGFRAQLHDPYLLTPPRKEPSADDLEAAAERWQSQLAFWQTSLTQLADEFCAGMAEHRARQPKALQYCRIRPFLRELTPEDSEQDGDDDDAPPTL